jgi:hypothetical protein
VLLSGNWDNMSHFFHESANSLGLPREVSIG